MQVTLCGQHYPVIADTGADQSAMTLPLFRRLSAPPRLRPYSEKVSLFGTSGRAVGQLSILAALQPTVRGVTLHGEFMADFLVVDGDSEAIVLVGTCCWTRPVWWVFLIRLRCVRPATLSSLTRPSLNVRLLKGLPLLFRLSIACLCRNVMACCLICLVPTLYWIVLATFQRVR
jgi:hypothetical protein